MVSKKVRIGAATVASFGVALSSGYIADEMQAEIMDITWGGGNASSVNPFVTYGGISADIDQIDNLVITTSLGGTSQAGQFFQWNDTFGTDGIGRTMELGVVSANGVPGDDFGPMSMAVVEVGDILDPSTFVGQLNAAGTAPGDLGTAGNGPNMSATTFHGTGSAYIAVRPLEAPTNLYWFKVSFVGQGDITYQQGEYGSAGECLVVGGTDGDPCGEGCDNALGDVNGDGEVDILDVAPFVAAITGEFVCEADINEDMEVDILDVAPFVALITGGGG